MSSHIIRKINNGHFCHGNRLLKHFIRKIGDDFSSIKTNISIKGNNVNRTTESTRPLFTFGVIADVQHADIKDAINGTPPEMRFYRHALEKFKEAVGTWNESKVDFAIQLGDIIDGFSKKHGHRDNDFQNLLNVVREFKSTGLPVRKKGDTFVTINNGCHDDMSPYMCHLWGNHEFYNFSRSELWKSELNSFVVSHDSNRNLEDLKRADIDSSHGYYYSFTHEGFRFVVLDAYDISIVSRLKTSKVYEKADEILLRYNSNLNLAKPDANNPHFVSWNGALGDNQLAWFRNELAQATECSEKVIVLSHIPLHGNASDQHCLLWNHAEVLGIVNSFDCVVACLAGHFHEGGCYHDRKHNIHHLTFPGVIERDPATNAFAVVQVYRNSLKINGFGKLKSRVLIF